MQAIITDKYSNTEYHALEAVSKSMLDRVERSPLHYLHKYTSIGADTARIGTLLHSAVLEDIDDVLVVPPITGNKNATATREEWDAWFADHGATEPIATGGVKAGDWLTVFQDRTGKQVMTQAEKDQLLSIKGRCMDVAGDYFQAGIAEQSILFSHLDMNCKARPDWISHSRQHCIIDLKSCEDASESAFRRSVKKYRYDVQAAFYSLAYFSVFEVWPEFWFLAAEKKPPYAAALYKLDEAAMQAGHEKAENNLLTIKECIRSGKWPGYPGNDDLRIYFNEPRGEIVPGLEDLMA